MENRPQGWAHEQQNLHGRKVLVTGGTTGIGRATARLLAASGADVMIFGREQQPLQDALRDIEAVASGKAVGVTADQSQTQEIARVFREVDTQLGGIDVLVNNAAQPATTTDEMSPEDIEFVIRTNLLGYMVCAKHAIERMGSGGHIVNIGSMSANTREQQANVYVATKAAIQGWSESLRKELFERGIRVSLLELGKVGTNLHGEPPDVEGQRRDIRQEKMLTAEDIAEAVYYCLIQPPRCDVLEMRISPHMQGL